jgi:hypothetical protein
VSAAYAGFCVVVCARPNTAESLSKKDDDAVEDLSPDADGPAETFPPEVEDHSTARDPTRGGLSALIRSLPLYLGGMGIARYSWIAGQMGRAMSRRLLLHFLDGSMPEVPWLDQLRTSFPSPGFGNCCPLELELPMEDRLHIVELNTGVQTSYPLHSDDVTNDVSLHEIRNTTLSYHAVAAVKLLEERYSVAQAAWFASSQFMGSGRWLTSPAGVTQPPALTLSDSEFRAALRMT